MKNLEEINNMLKLSVGALKLVNTTIAVVQKDKSIIEKLPAHLQPLVRKAGEFANNGDPWYDVMDSSDVAELLGWIVKQEEK